VELGHHLGEERHVETYQAHGRDTAGAAAVGELAHDTAVVGDDDQGDHNGGQDDGEDDLAPHQRGHLAHSQSQEGLEALPSIRAAAPGAGVVLLTAPDRADVPATDIGQTLGMLDKTIDLDALVRGLAGLVAPAAA
jgi:hypothetical protein